MPEQRFLKDEYPFKSELKDVTPLVCAHCGKQIVGVVKTINVTVDGKIIPVAVCLNAPDCDKNIVTWLDKNNKLWQK
jgi:hypothetical protein